MESGERGDGEPLRLSWLVKFALAQLNDFLRRVNANGGVYGVLLAWREALTIKGWS